MSEVTPEKVVTTEERLKALEDAVKEHTKVMTDVRSLLGAIKEHVEPTIEAISKSPIGKMMGL